MSVFGKRVFGAVVVALALLVLVAIGWWITGNRDTAKPAGTDTGRSDRAVLYWYDPMRPDQHFDAPGKSPFMDMQLMPKYGEQRTSGDATVRVSDILYRAAVAAGDDPERHGFAFVQSRAATAYSDEEAVFYTSLTGS